MVQVTKADGSKARFDRSKIIRTCKRAGVSREIAEKIAFKVESEIYKGITTKKILDKVLRELRKYEAKHSMLYGLKSAIATLNPEQHEFEFYIEHLLREHGYKTAWNKIIKGECVEHQIDIIAEKDNKRYLVECKHHINPHRFGGLDTCLEVWAVLEDIQNGYKKGVQRVRYDNSWLILNTKFSKHALRYAKGKKLLMTSWNFPPKSDLRSMVETKGLYPITILNLSKEQKAKLERIGIILLKELVETPVVKLHKKTGIPNRTLKELLYNAEKIQGS